MVTIDVNIYMIKVTDLSFSFYIFLLKLCLKCDSWKEVITPFVQNHNALWKMSI